VETRRMCCRDQHGKRSIHRTEIGAHCINSLLTAGRRRSKRARAGFAVPHDAAASSCGGEPAAPGQWPLAAAPGAKEELVRLRGRTLAPGWRIVSE